MFWIIFNAVISRRDQHWRRFRRVSPQKTGLAGDLTARGDEDVVSALAFRNAKEKRIIRFFIYRPIRRRIRSKLMQLYAFWALIIVALYIEKRFAVGGPNCAAYIGALNRFIMFGAGLYVANTDREIFRSQAVNSIGDEALVRAVGNGADIEEF